MTDIDPRPPAGPVPDLLIAHNASRPQFGAAPLAWDDRLAALACRFAGELSARGPGVPLSHDRCSGLAFSDEIALALGRPVACAENADAGSQSLSAVMGAWFVSDGHRANMFGPDWTHLGGGIAYAADGTPYWVVQFARLSP